MGCWNATCQVSQLPIHAGEEVRFLLLVKSPFRMDSTKGDAYSYMKEGQKEEDFGYQPNADAGREGVYSDNFWTPEFVPVRAKYNDYGSVEDIDTKSLNWSIWLETINKRMIEINQGSNQYHDPAVKKDMELSQLLEVLQEGRLIFSYWYKNYRVPVAQTMIREDVYQSLLKIKADNLWWSKERDYSPEEIYKDGLTFFSKEKIEKAKKYAKDYSDPEVYNKLKDFLKKMG